MAQSDRPRILATIKRYGQRLSRFIRGKVGSDQEAEDILQDVWFQLSSLVDLDDIDSMSGWLYRVARNRIIDKYRKKRDTSLEDLIYSEEGGMDFTELLIAEANSPEEEFFKELFWSELLSALDELPEDQKNAFVWNEIDGLTLQEIADKTGQKLKTVISRKRYAVQHLRERLRLLYQDLNN